MSHLLRRLSALDPRVALTVMAAVVFLIAFESWVVLRAPLAELQTLRATRARLESAVARDAANAADADRLTRELGAMDKGLGGPLRSDDAMLPFLITSLDAIAVRHGVSLGGVKPASQRPLGAFEEVSFNVDARGSYRALFDWLRAVVQEVEPLIATDFSLKSADEGQRVALAVRLAAYRVPALAASQPVAAK